MQQQSVRSSSESYFWPVVWAVTLHALMFAMLFVSFHFAPDLPPPKPIVQVTLYSPKSQSQATTQTNQKIAGESKKTAARQYEQEQLEAKKEEQQKQEAAEQKKADAAKQAEVAKKEAEADAKKEAAEKAAEQKKLAEIAKKKSEEEKKKAAEEAKKKAAAEAAKKKAAEDAKKKKAEADRKKKAQEAARKSAADQKAAALAELLSDTTERQQALADEVGDQVTGNYDDLIRSLVTQNWIRPPSARNGMSVTVQVNMLPDGSITNASVLRSSGDAAFDSSAVSAVRNVGRITEMQGISPSDFAPYRSFKMTFTPEDLDL